MGKSKVTTEGLEGARPGRQALTGAHVGPGSATREQPMVPKARFESYYGQAVLNPPAWKSPDVPGYLFLGGLAGASSVLGAAAELAGARALARVAKVGAAGAGLTGLGLLVHDLGRPTRALNMLRMLKVTSPMSVGSWLLSVGWAPAATVAALSDLTGLLPGLGAAATAGAALTGPGVAAYTGALIADTAVPAWHDAYRELPYLFVGSGAMAAGGLGLAGAPLGQNGLARRMGVLGAAVELAATALMERRLAMVAEPYHDGSSGWLMRLGKVLASAGTAGALAFGRRSRLGAAGSGAALLAGSALTRFGIFEAGNRSARDPKYVVEPQKTRLAARASASSS
jgi:DMSO reductase anchor subunit